MAIRIWFIAILLFFSCLHVDAQQANTVKPPKKAVSSTIKRNPSANNTIKQKRDSTHHVHTVIKKSVPVKKDSVRHATRAITDTQNVHRAAKSLHVVTKKDSATTKRTSIAKVVRPHKDSLSQKAKVLGAASIASTKHVVSKADPLWQKNLAVPYLPLKAKPIFVMDEPHPFESKDVLFFTVCGLLVLYGIVRTAFPKYTDSLFRNLVSFSSIDKSDYSMGQNNLPSLLLNILFCLSLGLLAALILEQSQSIAFPTWKIWLAGSAVIATIYLVKFVTIYASGWIFNAPADASAYMYVVFLVNKVIGLISLPAILIFAFAENAVLNGYILTIGSILIIVLLLYRYVVTFSVITRNLQLNAFHFFLYLCSVEIIPILILYKLFFKDLNNWI